MGLAFVLPTAKGACHKKLTNVQNSHYQHFPVAYDLVSFTALASIISRCVMLILEELNLLKCT